MISGKNEASPLVSIRNPLSKIRQYLSTFELTRGFLIALLSSAFIYLEHWGLSHPLLTTFFGLTSLYLLLQEEQKTWFFSGFFIGLFWFWWIGLSFEHYGMVWAIPIVTLFVALGYGIIFWFIAYLAKKITLLLPAPCSLLPLTLKATGLLVLSYIHPFGFDWLKPELMFVESYLGIEKWQFSIILIAITLSMWKKQLLYLFLVLLAYQPTNTTLSTIPDNIQIVTTHTSVKDKWKESLHPAQFDLLFQTIEHAIDANKTLVVLPESVFPVFINRSQALIDRLQEKAKKISIVTGGLYWDGKVPRNSTYIFTKERVQVANKVLLVPFGESNPLPEFLSKWVNKVFYDGAVDYKASSQVTDYKIGDKSYRNAICFEATSEKLYEGNPKQMIVLSNNGWFTPSTEPTLQKLLLQYYSKKYGTIIYHAVNMSESYIIADGIVRIQK
ncbi:MAG: apolipoprotein N-acyltransferase [Sulfurovum sp.]|nr:MAG: apolipoprotein N-acyltransferase [Sulfurovum sp.]